MAKKKYRTSDTVVTTTSKNPSGSVKEEIRVVKTSEQKVFHRFNYILMVVSCILLVVGYLLMMGGRQEPDQFNYEEIYSFTRITLSPIVIVLGFAMLIFSILWKPKSFKENEVSKS